MLGVGAPWLPPWIYGCDAQILNLKWSNFPGKWDMFTASVKTVSSHCTIICIVLLRWLCSNLVKFAYFSGVFLLFFVGGRGRRRNTVGNTMLIEINFKHTPIRLGVVKTMIKHFGFEVNCIISYFSLSFGFLVQYIYIYIHE